MSLAFPVNVWRIYGKFILKCYHKSLFSPKTRRALMHKKLYHAWKMLFMFKFFYFLTGKIIKEKNHTKHTLGIPQKSLETLSDIKCRKHRTRHEDFSVDGSIKDLHMSDFMFLFLSDWWPRLDSSFDFIWAYFISLFYLALLRNNKCFWKGYQSISDCLQRMREIWHDDNQYSTF